MTLKIKKLHPNAIVPKYAHGNHEDAGMDLYSLVNEHIPPGQARYIKTGISIELLPGYEGQVRSRSGLAVKHGLFVLNSPGTIDPSYRGEVGVILFNTGNTAYLVNPGDRIGQLVISQYVPAEIMETEVLSESDRGVKGLGSTGL